MKTNLLRTQTILLLLFVYIHVNAQTPPVYPSPDHGSDHDAIITGKITISPDAQVLAGIIAKLSRVIPGTPNSYVTVPYALSDTNGNFSLTGQSGVTYRIDYVYPSDGFIALSNKPSSSFSTVTGNQAAPDGGLTLQRIQNTITNCNVTATQLTDWSKTISVPKAIQLNNLAVLKRVAVYGATRHPLIEVQATTASIIRSLKIGADVLLSEPGGYSDLLESLGTFTNTPTAQNINLTAGQKLTYYDI